MNQLLYPRIVRRSDRIMRRSDQLSELPDSLRVQILSHLEMKDVVKTGILSKRWKHLWTQTQNVVYGFTVGDDLEKSMSDKEIIDWKREHLFHILSFIDRTLLQCVSSMKKFSLTGFDRVLGTHIDVMKFVDRWIAFVSTKNLESLNLDLNLYRVPHCFYTDFTSLTMLHLENVTLLIVSPVKWPVLKCLELRFISLEDSTFDNILLGSPILETIILNAIRGIKYLNVMSSSVQYLALSNIKYEDDDILEIRAPWLQTLKIDEVFHVRKCRLVDLSSLSSAWLTFLMSVPERNLYIEHCNGWIAAAIELLRAPLSFAAELCIGSELIQVLSMLKLLGKPFPPFKCKNLRIVSPIWKYDLTGIAGLLENAHSLETLIIKVDERKIEYPFPMHPVRALFTNQSPHSSFPEARFVHLKFIKVDYFINPLCEPMHVPWPSNVVHGVCFDDELLIHILRSAVALERLVMVISMIPSCYKSECSDNNCVYYYVNDLSSKLLATCLPEIEGARWELTSTKTRFEFSRSNRASILCKTDDDGNLCS